MIIFKRQYRKDVLRVKEKMNLKKKTKERTNT